MIRGSPASSPVTETEGGGMGRQTNVIAVIFVAAMVGVIVGADLLFFRDRFWERLLANIGIVMVFVAFYLRFFRR